MKQSKRDQILLVDDERHLLMAVKNFLAFEQFDVHTAKSGEDALKVLETLEPDIIVLDISMPGMGGVGFLKRISDSQGVPRYPVLVLTARSTLREFFETVQVDGFLEKPCDEAELLANIRRILARRTAAPDAGSSGPKRVLLAEDDVRIANRLSDALSKKGYEVQVVQSGPDVLEKATTLHPSVIVMKDILPRLNGSAVASLLNVMTSVSMIPVVLYDETRLDARNSKPWRTDIKCVRCTLDTSDTETLLAAIERAAQPSSRPVGAS